MDDRRAVRQERTVRTELATSLNVFEAKMPAERAIARCVAAGFHLLDFNYCDHCQRLLTLSWSEEERWARAVRSAADAADARFVQMHGPIFNKFGRGPEHEAMVALMDRSLRTAAILGVPWVVWEPDVFPGPFDAAHRRALRDGNAARVRALLPLAERLGVGIAIENLPDSAAASRKTRRWYGAVPEELIELVDALDHPLIGACWDTGHAQLQGLEQGQALRALGSRLKATHVQDNDGRADQHLLPYHGKVDWPAVLAALAAIDYGGAFTYEVHNAIHVLPDALRDAGLRYAHQVGTYLLQLNGSPT